MRHLDMQADVLEVVQGADVTALLIQGNEKYRFEIPTNADVHARDTVIFNFPCAVSNYQTAIDCYAYDTATIKRGEKTILSITGEKAKELEESKLEKIARERTNQR